MRSEIKLIAEFCGVYKKPESGAEEVGSALPNQIVELLPTLEEPPDTWLFVRVYDDTGVSFIEGWVRDRRLKPLEPTVDKENFARQCLTAARSYGADHEALLALADYLTNCRNVPPRESSACGPFLIFEQSWKDFVNGNPDLAFAVADRFISDLQPFAAASGAGRAMGAMYAALNRHPSYAELAFAHIFGLKSVTHIIAGERGGAPDIGIDKVIEEYCADGLAGSVAAKVFTSELSMDKTDLLKQGKGYRTLGGVLKQLESELETPLKRARTMFAAIEPDLYTSPLPVEPLPKISEQSGDPTGSLDLGVNAIYRDFIETAAVANGLDPAGLAALIDAEAAKKATGLWDPKSRNPKSTASGLTQFLRGTWVDMACRSWTTLNQKAAQAHLLTGSNKVRGPDELKLLLDLRFDAELSIVTAAEFARKNLQYVMERSPNYRNVYAPSTGDGRARLAYLAHHEGAAGAVNYLRGQKPVSYVAWLDGYIAKKIIPGRFRAKGVASSGTGGAFATDAAPASSTGSQPTGAGASISGEFATRLAAIVSGEWDFFGRQMQNIAGKTVHEGFKEGAKRAPGEPGQHWYERVGDYWRDGVGRHDLDGLDHGWYWSAAFISWAVKKAGAGSRFRYESKHSFYISQAIRDCLNVRNEAGYWCYRLAGHKPRLGDIVCWARETGVDYDNQKGGDYDGHCDIVVDVREGQIDVIGGNVGDSVTRRPLALDGDGYLLSVDRPGERLFAIMMNRIT